MSDKCRVAVMVSGGGTNLAAILKAADQGIIKSGEISLVCSNNPNAYALERAKNAGIPTFCFRGEDGEAKLTEKLLEEKIDLIVLAGFLKILSKDFTERFSGRIINIHPALLPSFGGKGCYGIHVHEKALDYGVKVTGATVHFVNEVPDGGRIIAQKAVEVLDDDTPETLQKRVMEQAEWIILPKAVETVCQRLQEGKDE